MILPAGPPASQRLLQTFNIKIPPIQRIKLFTVSKSSQRYWTEHFLYLTAVSDACGGADNLVLDNIVHYAYSTMSTAMLFRMNLHRADYLRQAEELAQFTQSTETDVRVKHFGRDVVNVVESTKDVKKVEPVNKRLGDQGQKIYYLCGNTGHHKSSCPRRSKKK